MKYYRDVKKMAMIQSEKQKGHCFAAFVQLLLLTEKHVRMFGLSRSAFSLFQNECVQWHNTKPNKKKRWNYYHAHHSFLFTTTSRAK